MKLSQKIFQVLGGGALSVFAVVGCGQEHVQNPRVDLSPPTEPATTTTTSSAEVHKEGGSDSLRVSDELARACQIDFGSAETAPKFDFDRSELTAGDRNVLDQVARCLTRGPAKGRTLAIVGRTDPRGEQEYNMGLGERRADSAARYLRDLGVSAGSISTSSRGKLDASGTDEAGWQRDRRDDLELR